MYSVGDMLKSKRGCNFIILEILKNRKVKIKFLDNFGYETIVDARGLKRGYFKNPFYPSVFGVGYIGDGEYVSRKNWKPTYSYGIWNGIMQRGYSEKFKIKSPTYKNVTVCEEWHSYQNFAKWFDENYPKNIENVKFDLDKDLIQDNIENKIYSPETCVWLPHKVNSFLSNKIGSNISGYIGASWRNDISKWNSHIRRFEDGKIITLGHFLSIEEASHAYQQARIENVEKVKLYLRELNYLSEEIIQLIK